MEATTVAQPDTKRKSWRRPLAWGLLGALGLVPVGAVCGLIFLGVQAARGDLDLQLNIPGLAPTMHLKVDRLGPPGAPRRLSLGLGVKASDPSSTPTGTGGTEYVVRHR